MGALKKLIFLQIGKISTRRSIEWNISVSPPSLTKEDAAILGVDSSLRIAMATAVSQWLLTLRPLVFTCNILYKRQGFVTTTTL